MSFNTHIIYRGVFIIGIVSCIPAMVLLFGDIVFQTAWFGVYTCVHFLGIFGILSIILAHVMNAKKGDIMSLGIFGVVGVSVFGFCTVVFVLNLHLLWMPSPVVSMDFCSDHFVISRVVSGAHPAYRNLESTECEQEVYADSGRIEVFRHSRATTVQLNIAASARNGEVSITYRDGNEDMSITFLEPTFDENGKSVYTAELPGEISEFFLSNPNKTETERFIIQDISVQYYR